MIDRLILTILGNFIFNNKLDVTANILKNILLVRINDWIIKSFAWKPSKGGMPIKDNINSIKIKANIGYCLFNPLKLVISSIGDSPFFNSDPNQKKVFWILNHFRKEKNTNSEKKKWNLEGALSISAYWKYGRKIGERDLCFKGLGRSI